MSYKVIRVPDLVLLFGQGITIGNWLIIRKRGNQTYLVARDGSRDKENLYRSYYNRHQAYWRALEAQKPHIEWRATQDYESLLAEHNASVLIHDAWLLTDQAEPEPIVTPAPSKPAGYYTQEEVDASVASHVAWEALPVEERGVEPVVLKRPADIPEPAVPVPPDPVPNTPDPEFTAEELAAQAAAQAKIDRANDVANIKVTTSFGNTFDGDEVAQGRMARGILAMQQTQVTSVMWKLADNTFADASLAELQEALALAGQAQINIWLLRG